MEYIDSEVTCKENDTIDTEIIFKEKLKDCLVFINILYTHIHSCIVKIFYYGNCPECESRII